MEMLNCNLTVYKLWNAFVVDAMNAYSRIRLGGYVQRNIPRDHLWSARRRVCTTVRYNRIRNDYVDPNQQGTLTNHQRNER